jgi:hypothetical protein
MGTIGRLSDEVTVMSATDRVELGDSMLGPGGQGSGKQMGSVFPEQEGVQWGRQVGEGMRSKRGEEVLPMAPLLSSWQASFGAKRNDLLRGEMSIEHADCAPVPGGS